MQKLLLFVDKVSTFVGQSFSWLIVGLTMLISWEVFSRYALDNPHAWAFDAMIMLYGTLFMMAGPTRWRKTATCAGTCSTASFRRGCRRGSTLRSTSCSSSPASSRCLGGLQLCGRVVGDQRAFEHHRRRPPIYPFKTIIPVAGAFILVQGVVEIIRCVICLKEGDWPSREEDVEEVDVGKLEGYGARQGRGYRQAGRVRSRQDRGDRREKRSLVRSFPSWLRS